LEIRQPPSAASSRTLTCWRIWRLIQSRRNSSKYNPRNRRT
jgi:hypothetical protein